MYYLAFMGILYSLDEDLYFFYMIEGVLSAVLLSFKHQVYNMFG